jgi:hypothetical protein
MHTEGRYPARRLRGGVQEVLEERRVDGPENWRRLLHQRVQELTGFRILDFQKEAGRLGDLAARFCLAITDYGDTDYGDTVLNSRCTSLAVFIRTLRVLELANAAKPRWHRANNGVEAAELSAVSCLDGARGSRVYFVDARVVGAVMSSAFVCGC